MDNQRSTWINFVKVGVLIYTQLYIYTYIYTASNFEVFRLDSIHNQIYSAWVVSSPGFWISWGKTCDMDSPCLATSGSWTVANNIAEIPSLQIDCRIVLLIIHIDESSNSGTMASYCRLLYEGSSMFDQLRWCSHEERAFSGAIPFLGRNRTRSSEHFLHSHAWFWGLWKLDGLSSMSISFNISTMFSVKAKADFSSFPGGSHWWPLGIAGATGIFRAANECILGTQFGG